MLQSGGVERAEQVAGDVSWRGGTFAAGGRAARQQCPVNANRDAIHDPQSLPEGLPIPLDDGACLGLRGAVLPDIGLMSTVGVPISMRSNVRHHRGVVLFFYPRTGIPGRPPGLGIHGETWDSIPGARGCTPQSCGFRDLYESFRSLGVEVFGVSTNSIGHQEEFRARNRVPYHFLSDADLRLTRTMKLPTFEFAAEGSASSTLLRRMAWYVEADETFEPRIVKVWYPVFPPDRNAAEVLGWLNARHAITLEPIGPPWHECVRAELERHWHSTRIRSRGRAFRADELPGYVALLGDEPVGQVTLHQEGDEIEVVTLSGDGSGARGVGSKLMDEAEREARRRGCSRLFLTTTNDNLAALRFYQRRGMVLAALHRGQAEVDRRAGAAIPLVGSGGIPIRDELELEWVFERRT